MINLYFYILNLKEIFFNYLMETSHYIYMEILVIAIYIQLLHPIFGGMDYHLQNSNSTLNFLAIESLWNRHLDLLSISGKLMPLKYFFAVRVCLWQLFMRLLFF